MGIYGYCLTGLLWFFAGVFLSASRAQDLQKVLLNYWDFEAPSDFKGKDEPNFQGKLLSGGKIGNGLALNAQSSGVNMANGLELFDNYTITLWIKPLSVPLNGVLLHQYNNETGRFFRLSAKNNMLILEYRDEYGRKHYIDTPGYTFQKDKYHFIAVGQSNAHVALYADLKQLAESITFDLNIRASQANDQLVLGNTDQKIPNCSVMIDELLCFGRRLGPEELASICNRTWVPTSTVHMLSIAKVVPPPILGRTSKLLAEPFTIESDSITIEFFDKDKVDNDTISIYFNNVLVVSKQRVDKTRKRISVPISKNSNNFLSVFAENLGDLPPNTASVRIYAGAQRLDVDMKSDFIQNGTIQLKHQTPPKILKTGN